MATSFTQHSNVPESEESTVETTHGLPEAMVTEVKSNGRGRSIIFSISLCRLKANTLQYIAIGESAGAAAYIPVCAASVALY